VTFSDITGLQLLASSDNLVDMLLELAVVGSHQMPVETFAQNQLTALTSSNRLISQVGESQNVILPAGVSEAVDKAIAGYLIESAGTSQFNSRLLESLINLEQIRIAEANQLLSTTSNTAVQQAVAPQIATDNSTLQQAQTLLTQLNSGGNGSSGSA
jgi:hypothetical protein